jgi:hypothetical protein
MSLEHPSWCSPADCLVTAHAHRIHLSRPAAARSSCGDLTVTVQLGQIGDDEDPVVTMVAAFADYGPDHPAEEVPVRLDADLARAVGWMLLTTGRQAAPGQNGNPRR